MEYYATSLQHILAELERIDLLIWLQVWKARQLQTADHSFQGLYLSEQEVDTLLAKPTGMPHWANASTSLNLPKTQDALEKLSTDINELKAESTQQSITLRLDQLARLFDLSLFEVDILLVCLAPELDLRYERLFAYLQDDLTKKRPSVDLVLNLLCPSFDQKIAARCQFAPDAPLFKYHLLSLFEDNAHQNPPFFSKYLKVDDPVVNYLLGFDLPDDRLASSVKTFVLPRDVENHAVPDSLKQCSILWTDQATNERNFPLFYFQGPSGVGKKRTAASVCQELGLMLHVVDVAQLLKVKDVTFETAVRLVLRDALFKDAALYLANFDLLLNEDNQPWHEMLFSELATYRGLVFLAGESVWEPSGGVYERPCLRIEFLHPTYHERKRWWHTLLDEVVHTDDRSALDEVADKFCFTIRQIQDAGLTARNLTLRRNPPGGPIIRADLYTACRLHSNQRLTTLAQKLIPRYRWQDIVLPSDQLQQLRELCASVKHRALVYHQWGFDRKLSLGKGLNALFAGPSGTGKTMAAEIIANELGLDLYKIDLSTIVSKYIGETEKNLARIFAEASTSNAILFFDEADALFGKRSEVKDSHDRYANIEISYLLQKMDEYEGITILTTNLRKNMDEAFVRRIAFTVYFPLPDAANRLSIWQGIWPPEVPRTDELDLPFMARQFKLSGGNIKNIALGAAFLAADNGQMVGMSHLILATKREFQKSGKVCVKAEFGPYYPLVEDRP